MNAIKVKSLIKLFKDMTIKKKITAVMTFVSLVSLLFAGIIFMLFSVYNQYRAEVMNLEVLAKILAQNCKVSIAFNLPEETEKMLEGFKEKTSIDEVAVFTSDNDEFAHFSKSKENIPSHHQVMMDDGVFIKHNAFHVFQSIFMGKEKIGTVYIDSSLKPFYLIVFRSVTFLILILLLSMGVIYLFSLKLQQYISDPIIKLSSVALKISDEKDYSIRATKVNDDEVGKLIDSFNAMLEQIQNRDETIYKSELRYANLLEGMIDGFCAYNQEGKIFACNSSFEKMLGFPREELLSLTIQQITPSKWNDVEKNITENEVLKRGYSEIYEKELWRKTGESLPVELRTYVIKNEAGDIEGFWNIVRDITLSKKNKEDKILLEEQLRQSQKIESIGRLAGGIAHDFNNFLSPIIGYAEMLLSDLEEDSEHYQDIKEIFNAGKKAKEITKQLLAFSRKQLLSLKSVTLGSILEDFEKMMRRSLHENIIINVKNNSNYFIKADITQVQQILLNLALNSQDAMPKGGQLDINISDVTLDESYSRGHFNINPGVYVQLVVSDTGCGMDKETLDHVFDPFFTTKGYSKGTGLGLSTVFGIVKQHGGYIWVYTEPKIGTSVKIYFPVTDEHPEVERMIDKSFDSDRYKGSERIMIVEDNEMVNKLVVKILGKYGYEVNAFLKPKDALKWVKNVNEPFDLLLTDLIMPDMNGKELYDKIREFKPDLKVIYMSGYSDEVIGHHGILDSDITFIQKPLSEQKLIKNLREMLDS